MAATTRLTVSEDRLSVRLDCVVERGTEEAVVAEIVAEAEKMGISPAKTDDDINAILVPALALGSRVHNVLLTQGSPATPPVDGAIAWQREFFTSQLIANPKTGQIDYRQRLDNSIVAEGDILATLTPPQPGTPGVDVFGKAIQPAKPNAPKIRAGNGVSFDETAQTFTATATGRLRFAKGVLSVDLTYAIAGSVGLKTGHINHPGSVDVTKDIEPDSILEAGGTVHVAGAIEECDVVAGGDVLIGGGIVGGGKTRVQAGGSIEAAYAERAELDAGHDIRIRRELIQCTARAQGEVLIPEGQIIGGAVTAIFGIDVGQAGSHGDVRTVLTAGVDPSLHERLSARNTEAKGCHEQIAELNERVRPFKVRGGSLTPVLRAKLDALLAELAKAEAHRDFIQQEIEQLIAELRERAKAVIRIRRHVFPDTHLCIGHGKLIVAAEADGPLVARLNDEGIVVLEPATQT